MIWGNSYKSINNILDSYYKINSFFTLISRENFSDGFLRLRRGCFSLHFPHQLPHEETDNLILSFICPGAEIEGKRKIPPQRSSSFEYLRDGTCIPAVPPALHIMPLMNRRFCYRTIILTVLPLNAWPSSLKSRLPSAVHSSFLSMLSAAARFSVKFRGESLFHSLFAVFLISIFIIYIIYQIFLILSSAFNEFS